MPIKPFELVDFGGVDSRSNPLNMPQNRALYMRNWCPKQDGHLELRYGYTAEQMSNVAPAPVHTIIPYASWDGTKNYLIVGQDTNLSIHDLTTKTDTPAVIRGNPITSSAPWGFYYANNRLHIGNGADQKFFDGTTFRDNGLRAPTATEVAGLTISEGVRELSTLENSSITLTAAAGGTFPATTGSGRSFFIAFFDTDQDELGPSTIAAGANRVTFTANQKITLAALPVPTNPNWIKLVGFTDDGGSPAYFATSTAVPVPIQSCSKLAVFQGALPPSRPALYAITLVVNSAGHPFVAGDVIYQNGTGHDGIYVVFSSDANSYTVILINFGAAGVDMIPFTVDPEATTGGNAFKLVSIPNGTTSVVLTSPLTVSPSAFPDAINELPAILMNRNAGLPASVITTGPNAGYQFAASIYNPITQHVGNYVPIGSRHVNTERVNIRISGLPNYATVDSEWNVLIGRTGDGATVPYVVTDDADNFIAAESGQTSIVVASTIDGNLAMPTRNGVIPPQCSMFAHVDTANYAADAASPFVRKSGDLSTFTTGIFVGVPEQSWAGDDLITFPTNQPVRGICEEDDELFVGTLRDCAILSDQNGQPVWKGPWNVGLAGPFAMSKADPYGFFWATDKKEVATLASGLPTPISEEYEAGELAQFSDQSLGQIRMVYFRDPLKQKDELRIEGQTATAPLTVIHDFKLRDSESPFGQAYSSTFEGPLATSFIVAVARDSSNRVQVYAGDQNGFLYQLYSGANDVGNEYEADAIMLANSGPNRTDVPYLDFFGDGQIKVSVGLTLDTTLDTFTELSPGADGAVEVPDAEGDSLWRAHLLTPGLHNHVFIRFQLTSHSEDGNLTLNQPPHIPLETYGRLYEVVSISGDSRGK